MNGHRRPLPKYKTSSTDTESNNKYKNFSKLRSFCKACWHSQKQKYRLLNRKRSSPCPHETEDKSSKYIQNTYLLIVALSVYTIGVIFRNWSPVPIHSRLTPLPVLLGSVYLDSCGGLWSTWTWVLYMVIDKNIFVMFYMMTYSFVSTIVKELSFFHCIVLASFSKIRYS